MVNFAGSREIAAALSEPLSAYEDVWKLSILLTVLDSLGCRRFLYMSTAHMYKFGGSFDSVKEEDAVLENPDPFARSRLMCEQILKDYAQANGGISCISLRTLFVGGSHPTYTLGQDPDSIPNSWLPYLNRCACNISQHFEYQTGNNKEAVRDYIHVCDLAAAFVSALKKAD